MLYELLTIAGPTLGALAFSAVIPPEKGSRTPIVDFNEPAAKPVDFNEPPVRFSEVSKVYLHLENSLANQLTPKATKALVSEMDNELLEVVHKARQLANRRTNGRKREKIYQNDISAACIVVRGELNESALRRVKLREIAVIVVGVVLSAAVGMVVAVIAPGYFKSNVNTLLVACYLLIGCVFALLFLL